MHSVLVIMSTWIGLNFAVPALIYYRRAPEFRHRVFKWTAGGLAPIHNRLAAHTLVRFTTRQGLLQTDRYALRSEMSELLSRRHRLRR
jgi:hypothetical protein